ncbi:hypothetical protein M422DRAFT_786136 [Sphaerobolus stellatus SS14]|uniref:F-box domain-containing protein n=1 Tax=Sphaerobolus stellatus (strain SS14) TaxID=990650 RepID=A0A0C9T3X2_SPHS4|nr:hypothetical protein M422DRAFT_786136 [Sphaerobolus stellatus SS14]
MSSTRFPALPNELYLGLLSHCSLKVLVALKGVCREWRRLVPIADIPPDRHALLEFYLYLIDSGYFLLTRSWILDNIKFFDHEAYLASLVEQGAILPEAFKLWITEWPAKAAIPWFLSNEDPNSDNDISAPPWHLKDTPPYNSILQEVFTQAVLDEAEVDNTYSAEDAVQLEENDSTDDAVDKDNSGYTEDKDSDSAEDTDDDI